MAKKEATTTQTASIELKPFFTEVKKYTRGPQVIIDETIETRIPAKNARRVIDTVFMTPTQEVKFEVYSFEGRVKNASPIDYIIEDTSRGLFKGKETTMANVGPNPFSHEVLTTGSDDEGVKLINRPLSQLKLIQPKNTWGIDNYSAASDD
jgi:hypothetical protein